jgi:hypothetical protein
MDSQREEKVRAGQQRMFIKLQTKDDLDAERGMKLRYSADVG